MRETCAKRLAAKRATALCSYSLAPQTSVDSLAVGAHRGARLGLLGHGKGLPAQRNDVLAVHCGVEDIVFLDVVKELRGVIATARGVFLDVWAFNSLCRGACRGSRCSTHGLHLSPSVSKFASSQSTLRNMHSKNSHDGSGPTSLWARVFSLRWLKRRRAQLITDAQESPGQDRHRREIWYAVLQFLRVPSLLIAGWLIYSFHAWVPAAFIVGVTFPLPWMAVVIGNSRGRPKDKREKNIYKPALARQMARAQAQQLSRPQAKALDSTVHETIEHSTIEHDSNDHTKGGPQT